MAGEGIVLEHGTQGRDLSVPSSLSLHTEPTFGLDARELAQLDALRTELGAALESAIRGNPDFATDDRMVRILRGNYGEIPRSVKYWSAMQQRRTDLGCDTIRAEVANHFSENFWGMQCLPARQVIQKYYVFAPNYAVTSQGDLMSLECTGRMNIRHFMQDLNEGELMRFYCYLMEWTMMKLATLSRRHNRIAGLIQLKDLDGLSFSQATCPTGMRTFAKINQMLHSVYPETLSRLVVLNTPPMFGMIWNLFKPLLPSQTLKKCAMTSRSSREQQEVLGSYLPATDSVMRHNGLGFYAIEHQNQILIQQLPQQVGTPHMQLHS